MPIIGNTVKVKGEFTDWSGVLTTPSAVTLTVYDKLHAVVTSSLLSSSCLTTTGTYETTYVVPDGYGDVIIEMTATVGTILVTSRKNVIREFATD